MAGALVTILFCLAGGGIGFGIWWLLRPTPTDASHALDRDTTTSTTESTTESGGDSGSGGGGGDGD